MMRSLAAGLLLGLLTLWAYQSVWAAEWVYEDRAVLTSALQPTGSWSRLVSLWTWQLTPTPRAAHALNLGLHLLIGGLAGWLARRLGLTPVGAWVVALLWWLHPLVVETAAYAKARSEQIVILGVLVALVATTRPWWRPLGLCGLLAGTLLALGGEESGIVVLGVIPLGIWYRETRQRRVPPRWASWRAVAALSVALLALAIVTHEGGLRAVLEADSSAGLADVNQVTWAQWLWVQSGAVAYWLASTVWLALLTPDLDADVLSTVVRGTGLVALAAMAGLAWHGRHRRPLATLALLLCLGTILPRLVVQTPRSYLNAAQFALPFMGLALLAGAGIDRLRTVFQGADAHG